MGTIGEIMARPDTAAKEIECIAADLELVADQARNKEHDFEVLQLLIEIDETVERLRRLAKKRAVRDES